MIQTCLEQLAIRSSMHVPPTQNIKITTNKSDYTFTLDKIITVHSTEINENQQSEFI